MTTAKKTTTKTPAAKAAEMQADAAKNMETIVESSRKALDQMVENGNASYEKMVTVSKERFEQVMSVVDDAKEMHEGNVDAVIATGNATMKAMETLSSELASYGKQTFEDNLAAAKATMSAKSVQEAMDLQRDFVKAAFDGFVAEANKLSDMVPQLAKESVEPISAQAKVAYDKVVKVAAA